MSLVVAKKLELAIAEQRDGMYDVKWRKYAVKEIIEYTEMIYVRDCATWREAVPSSVGFFKKPNPATYLVPIDTVETAWQSMPHFPGFESPYFYPGIHLAYHGYLSDFFPKISHTSSLHAIANFNGCDLPSAYYEDPALESIPAFTVTHDTFVYIYYNVHPLYDPCFNGLIPSLRIWNHHLEYHFRGVWDDGSTDIRCVPRWYRERRRGGDCFDSGLFRFIRRFRDEADVGTSLRYNSANRHLQWGYSPADTEFAYWPGTEEILRDFERVMDDTTFDYLAAPRPRGIRTTALSRAREARTIRQKLSSAKLAGRTVRIRRPKPFGN